ncbi:MMPL family transporter [Microbacterium oleivorans]|uniref:MMPL family transporter n=1 Tax=Microbacterium oleivorans TaxID=273677 RepID=A0A4R5YJX3_9MICO|nr:MMPL family transporter [Microbacterium oleivorans]
MAALLSRLGRFSARHRGWVVLTWLIALALLAVVALTGMKFTSGGFDVPGTDSSRAMSTLKEKFGETGTTPRSLQLVVQSADGPIVDDQGAVTAALSQLSAIEDVSAVSDPFNPARPYVSADGTTAVAEITFATLDNEQLRESAAHAVAEVAADIRMAGLTAEVGGSLSSDIPEILGPSELVGAAVAFLVLLLTFGSLVAAGANMGGALLGVGVGILGVLAFSAVSPIGNITPILAVMLGLAVGIDYGLFVLSRFRSELRVGREVGEAIGVATGTAGSAVVFAGATVVIALVGLTVVGIPFLGEMGLAAAAAVVVAVLMSLTLLPALMSRMGRRALPRRERSSTTHLPVPARWASAWGKGVTRRPLFALFGTVLVLGATAVPMFGMTTSLTIPGGEDPDSTTRAAYDLIAEEFGKGAQDPLVVLVTTTDDVTDSAADAQAEVEALPNVATVIPSGLSDDGSTALFTVLAESGPLDSDTSELVKNIRALESDGVSFQVTGGTAIALDSDQQLQTALITYLAIIVGLSLVLLIVLFRSLLVPLIATIGFLLSLGAALGSTVAVFQWGWLDALVQAPQGNPLLSLLPIIVTGILFGLAMDYQVFLVSRIHEAYRQGLSPSNAISAGFEKSATVVVAAAAIMTAVFGGFALSPSSLVGSIALALAVGVVADAILVRMMLIPALLALLGRHAWWLPKWLDRVLPHVDVEGSTPEGDATPVGEPVAVR